MQDKHFDEYNGLKESVLDILSAAKDFYGEHGYEKNAKAISDNIEVIKSGEFEVVVVGEFSTGKSTFLNALMREKYLTSYTKETTATINYLRHSSEADPPGTPGIVYYFNGEPEILPSLDAEVVASFVSTNSEMNVAETVDHLDLFIDSPFLENRVTLVDSPGLNGVKKGLGELTDEQITKSHAVIFMFTSEQAGKQSEFEYLKRVKDRVSNVLLVLNKIDCIKESENETVEGKVQELIDTFKTYFPEDKTFPEIFPIAAYPALVARSKKNLDYPPNNFDVPDSKKIELEKMSRMEEFEEKLLHFLTNSEKTIMQIKEPVQRLVSFLKDTIAKSENEIAIVENQTDGAELQKQISALKDTLSRLETELNAQRGEIRKAIKNVERDTLENLDRELESIRTLAAAELDELSSVDVVGEYAEMINLLLERRLYVLEDQLEENFRGNFFDAVQERYIEVVKDLEEKMEDQNVTKMEFDVHINVTANSINAGLENFNSMKDKLKKEMNDIENRKKALTLREDELIELNYQNENLKSRYDRLERTETELLRSFCPPEVSTRQVQRTREIDRTGLFHRFRDFVFGKRTEAYTDTETDDSERKAYIKQFNEEKARISERKNEIEMKLDKSAGSDKMLERVVSEREELQKELEEIREKEKEETRRFTEELDRKYAAEIARIKRKALSDVDGFLEKIRPLFKKKFAENRDIYTELLQDLIEQGIKAQIEQKREECDALIELKKEANDNKDKILSEKISIRDKAAELADNAEKLLDKINSIEIDRVQYQEI